MPFDNDPRYNPEPQPNPLRSVLRRQKISVDLKFLMILFSLMTAGLLCVGAIVWTKMRAHFAQPKK